MPPQLSFFLRRAAPSCSSSRRRLQRPSLSFAHWPSQRTYAGSTGPTQAASSHADTADSASSAVSSVHHHSDSPSPSPLDIQPSPVEVHQVIARTVQRGRWEHAMRLLLGALHSDCVPLAETYKLVLLAALRGGGWKSSVELTEQIATSPLSTTALYHTAVDLLLSQLGQESHCLSGVLASTVVEEVVPLMLADATRHVAWKPRHRESVLLVLTETNHPQLVTALFHRWSTPSTATATASASQGGIYACSKREAALLLAAFAATGDWRSAEALRARLPEVPGDALVDYVRAFIAALKRSGGTPAAGSEYELVPWEVAMDVSAKHKGVSSLTAAAAQLQHVAHQSTVPSDVSRWWWSAETALQARLTELRRRSLKSADEVEQLLNHCHVSKAGVTELLRAIEDAGVLSTSDDPSPYWMQWLNVVLALIRYCPSALQSSSGRADGLARLLPQPHFQLPSLTFAFASFAQASVGGGNDVFLWQYVAAYMLAETACSPHDGGVTRCLLGFTATLHYLLYAQERAAISDGFSRSAARAVFEVVEHACAGWTRRLQELQSRRHEDEGLDGRPYAIVECKDAIAVHLHTLGAFAHLPTFEKCVGSVLCSASGMKGVVDASILAYIKPLEQLGKPVALCEVMCTALSNVLSPSSRAAYILMLYTCHQLQEETDMAVVRSLLQRVESLLLRCTTCHADALVILCAQLQWCYGGSLESLRALAVPIFIRHRCWHVLARLLERCPLPLSAQEQRAAATCAEEQRREELQQLVSTGDVARAWELWREVHSAEAAALPLPVPIKTALVSLLLLKGRIKDACDVLATVPALGMGVAPPALWPHLGLHVLRHIVLLPELHVATSKLWEVVQVEGREVMKRETTMGLAMFAAMALSCIGREADAFCALRDAEAWVVQYDAKYHHQQQQKQQLFNAPSRDSERVEEKGWWCSSPLALHKTDAQLSEGIPPYVQSAMPPILLSALSRALSAATEPESAEDASTVLRVTRHVYLLTSRTAEAIEAWSAVLPQLYMMASKLAGEKQNPVVAAEDDAASRVLSMARRLVLHAVAHQIAVSPAVLQLAVTAITTKAFSPDSTATLIDGVQRALFALRECGCAGSNNAASTVEVIASQVARSLAAQNSYAKALEWVNEFNLWTATGDACIPKEILWQWIQGGCSAVQRQADRRASLHHECCPDAAVEERAAVNKLPAFLLPLQSLDALIECGAWQEAFSSYLHAILELKTNQLNTTTDFSHISEAALEYAELRDRYLAPHMLNRVMQLLAQNAPWRTCMQAWMLLCAHQPPFSWNVSASEVMPALQQLLAVMPQQGALPHDVGMVLVWITAQFGPPLPVVSPLLRHFSCAIASAPVWTRAEGEVCTEQLKQLQRLFGEQRVREAVQAIAEAESILVPPSLSVQSPSRVQSVVDGAVDAEAWQLPGRPLLSSGEVDALVVLAPLLLLATASQLEVLARRHLNGRFRGFELKALLYSYRDELLQRVSAAKESESDDALVQYLSKNATLHVYVSQTFAHGASKSDAAAAKWLAEIVFDYLIPLPLAARLWAACRTPAAALAACRWAPLVEEELCEALRRDYNRPPDRLRTAPHLSRQAIAHYWSCFHCVLAPELNFGPLELCCLAAYVPVLIQIRTQHPDLTQQGYKSAMRELAEQVHRAHFSPSRMPAEDTLAYLRRPRPPTAIAGVMTVAYKKLKVLHAQLFTGAGAAAENDVSSALPLHLRRHFAKSAVAVSHPGETPARLQQANLAAAARRLGTLSGHQHSTNSSSIPPSPTQCTPAIPTGQDGQNAAEVSPSTAELLDAAQRCLPSIIILSWVSWVIVACVAPRRPIPPAASLMFVEWVRRAAHRSRSEAHTDVESTSTNAAQLQWRAQAAAGQRELQQRRCRELSSVWQLLTAADAWSLMNVGHQVAAAKMVSPSPAQLKALPTKTRRDGGLRRKRTE
ncbi:hypothetical protein ABL78_6291 [Leptomonas seymouri]|uniref:Uncharacterized protein n=1 Tax=Leptomonas seymouri TaxID=5684 RepID=A0A0N1I107_LEPSE|nr:hypothetical protein ABL78_6291 [Leptomonas seymouri]|eukprot:KPI84650.1 hypothetical protein ABL78_6291 [Leptomonas seymouri]